uniref:Cobalt transport protein n=1 Tax=Cyanothece sp. (strain PCC 7425 / ATCC 29141) TaxID=395961 RepID=B8HMJ3_CYAP4
MDLLRSLPLGLYLEHPITWLHRLDPRVKLAGLMTFLLTPVLAGSIWRLCLVGLLILITFTARIPLRVWRQQMGWLLLLCSLILVLTAVMPDGLAISTQPRLPQNGLGLAQLTSSVTPAQNQRPFFWQKSTIAAPRTALPQPTGYRYVLFEQGPVRVTRRSLELGIRLSTLLFTLLYGTNLYLLTTAPEEITAGLENLMQPLRRLGLPVTEFALTLTLALRFIPLVLEEIQNLSRAVRTRAINWKRIGVRGAIKIWFMLADRLLENLFLRAEQIASAMQVRGFTGPDRYRNPWYQLQLRRGDWLVLAGLGLLWSLRLSWGGQG